ncbi:proliferating cell nuclear antigen (pcna) [bacterium]|jgi:proliferating cell nuclear antigen|nr:proliferating cell nuclear antigen (pcna) [bacterium]
MAATDYSQYRMYLKSVSGSSIRTLFETLKEVLHDVSLEFDSSGIKLVTMDGSRCALIYLKLHAENFEEYHCPGKFCAGVNMNNMFKLLRITGSHDTIVMYATHARSDELGITVTNVDRNSMTDFKLKLLDVDAEHINLPDVSFDAVMTLPSAFFQRICRDMHNLSDEMVVATRGNDLILSCTGDFASQETVISESENALSVQKAVTGDKAVQGRYPLKFLNLFCRASSLSNSLELYLKESYPLIIKFAVASLGEIRFCLAPRMDDV